MTTKTRMRQFIIHAMCLAAQAGLLAPAWAQDAVPESPERKAAHAHRAAERAHIEDERKAIAATRLKAETECYKRFAVEDCLRVERNRAREAEAGLRTREMQINDAERKEKAAERRRSIDEKQRAQPGPLGAASEAEAGVRGQPAHTTRLPRTPKAPTVPTPRAQDIRQREAEQAQRAADAAQRAASARERHAQEVKTAQERRARVEREQAAAAAAGRKPAAPLPAPAR